MSSLHIKEQFNSAATTLYARSLGAFAATIPEELQGMPIGMIDFRFSTETVLPSYSSTGGPIFLTKSLTLTPAYVPQVPERFLPEGASRSQPGFRLDFGDTKVNPEVDYEQIIPLNQDAVLATYNRTERADGVEFGVDVEGIDPERRNDDDLLIDAMVFCEAVERYIAQGHVRNLSGGITTAGTGTSVRGIAHDVGVHLSVFQQLTGKESAVTLLALRRMARNSLVSAPARLKQLNGPELSALSFLATRNRAEILAAQYMLKETSARLRSYVAG